MNGSDQWFRWSFNLFIFLVCFQIGMLVFLKSLFFQAERRLKDNQAQVALKCEDFLGEESYWPLGAEGLNLQGKCLDPDCPDSFWTSPHSASTDLHVVAVERAQPSRVNQGEVEVGHFVEVKVKASSRPQKLVLVSQNLMQWNLQIDEKSQLQEVMIVGPELVWVEGLRPETKLTYFSPEQICAFPTAWEEVDNPNNQFRRLALALESYTGQRPTSFQGKQVGRQFQVPLRNLLLVDRQPAQVQVESSNQETAPSLLAKDLLALGIEWSRDEQRLRAQSFQFLERGKRRRVPVPERTQAALYEASSDKLFLISGYRFGTWSWEREEFQPLYPPLSLPNLRWPTLMSLDPRSGDLFIYNEERGGEIYRYRPGSGAWTVWATRVGYGLVSFAFQPEPGHILATRSQGQKIASLVKISAQGEVLAEESLKTGIGFLKNMWRADLIPDREELWLKLSHPAHPGGDLYPLAQLLPSAKR